MIPGVPEISGQRAGIFGIIATLSLALVATISFHIINIQRIRISSPKITKPIKIVMLVDIQLGSVNKHYLNHIVHRTNALGPDLVVIPGDLFDADFVDSEYLESIDHLDAPVYFSYGNHEWAI